MGHFLSRKFLVAITAIVGELVASDADVVHAVISGVIAVAYIVSQAFVDRGKVEGVADSVRDGLERGKSALPLLLVAALGVSAMGCGANATYVVRATAVGVADAIPGTDGVIEAAYERITRQCDAGERDDCSDALAKLDRAERALAGLAGSLRTVDQAVAAAEVGRACELRPAVRQALEAARELVAALSAAGLDIPMGVPLAVAGLAALLGQVPPGCTEPVAIDDEPPWLLRAVIVEVGEGLLPRPVVL